MQAKGGVWFARGREIADYVRAHPEARREIDFDRHPLPLSRMTASSLTNFPIHLLLRSPTRGRASARTAQAPHVGRGNPARHLRSRASSR